VAADGPWQETAAVDAELRLQPEAPQPLAPRSRVRVHLGTSEVMARVHVRQPIAPGSSGLARLSFEHPTVARGGDRLVLRSFSPVATIGGGRVVDPRPPRRAGWPAGLASPLTSERLEALLARRPHGILDAELPLLLGVPPVAAAAAARGLTAARLVGDRWIAATTLEHLAQRAVAGLKAYHRAHPVERGMPLETLRHALRTTDALADRAVADAAAAGRLRLTDGIAVLSGFAPRVQGGDAEIDRVIRILEEADLAPPSLPELEQQTGRRDIDAILRLAARSGRVEAVERSRYYARPALDRFAAALAELGRDSLIAPSDLRDRLGISRKFMIPLLEWADAKGITERVGDRRRLRNA
jgi:selenocysteine-specific elongation factor